MQIEDQTDVEIRRLTDFVSELSLMSYRAGYLHYRILITLNFSHYFVGLFSGLRPNSSQISKIRLKTYKEFMKVMSVSHTKIHSKLQFKTTFITSNTNCRMKIGQQVFG